MSILDFTTPQESARRHAGVIRRRDIDRFDDDGAPVAERRDLVDDDGPGTTLIIDADTDPGFEARVMQHRANIQERATRNGGMERMTFHSSPTLSE